jgi:hypothetical protein
LAIADALCSQWMASGLHWNWAPTSTDNGIFVAGAQLGRMESLCGGQVTCRRRRHHNLDGDASSLPGSRMPLKETAHGEQEADRTRTRQQRWVLVLDYAGHSRWLEAGDVMDSLIVASEICAARTKKSVAGLQRSRQWLARWTLKAGLSGECPLLSQGDMGRATAFCCCNLC